MTIYVRRSLAYRVRNKSIDNKSIDLNMNPECINEVIIFNRTTIFRIIMCVE